MNISSFGTQLVKFRNGRVLTQQQLAHATGIKRAAICHYENGRREPDIKTLILLANFYGVTLDELVGRGIE